MVDHGFPAIDPKTISLQIDSSPAFEKLDKAPPPREVDELGLQLLRQGYLAQAEKCFRIARGAAILNGDEALVSRATLNWARSLDNRDTALAFRLLHSIDDSKLSKDLRPAFLNLLGSRMTSLCSFRAAEGYYTALLNASRKHNSRLEACVMGNRAILLFLMGEADESMKLNREAIDLLLQMDEKGMAGLVLMNMGTNAMHDNDYDKAYQCFDESQLLLDHTHNIMLATFLKANMGELELLVGDRDSALQLFKEAERNSLSSDISLLHVQTLVYLHLIEETSTANDVLSSLVDCTMDFNARRLYNEAAPIPTIAYCLAERLKLDTTPYLHLLNADFVGTPQYERFVRHYRQIFASLFASLITSARDRFPKFISHAPEIRAIKVGLSKLVDTDVKILLEGETGTGKSFLARNIHASSKRMSSAPFVVVDCTNLEENLFESKLFGHMRGSFTGAISDSVGLVELANGGTLFLDEIGELPLEIQGKLLYTIEEQRYRPIGAKSERRSEFRLIAATNRDIDSMLRDGAIRGDLYFRVAGFRVCLPPLRNRREDIVPLAELYLSRLNEKYGRRRSLRYSSWEALVKYNWPGNVRELNATIERGYHLSEGRHISIEDLGIGIMPEGVDTTDLSWYVVRREHLLRVLRLCHGNVSRAAKLLGLNRTTLIYKLKLLNIDREEFDPKRMPDGTKSAE